MKVFDFYNGHPERWCQHSLLNRQGQRCLDGALMHCYGEFEGYHIARVAVHRAIASEGYPYSITAYNDASTRTFEDILAVVKAADV